MSVAAYSMRCSHTCRVHVDTMIISACRVAAAVRHHRVLSHLFAVYRGRVYLQLDVPCTGPSVNPADCITTRPTGDIRGNGAYATAVIPAGSHIADYSGQLLNKADFFGRYPDGVVSSNLLCNYKYSIIVYVVLSSCEWES